MVDQIPSVQEVTTSPSKGGTAAASPALDIVFLWGASALEAFSMSESSPGLSDEVGSGVDVLRHLERLASTSTISGTVWFVLGVHISGDCVSVSVLLGN